MTAPTRVVIVGASIGGLTAAETLRQEGFDGDVVIVGDETHLPYTRPPLSKQILMGEWEPEQAAIRTAAELRDLGIGMRTGCTATALDIGGRTLHTSNGPLDFDELIIATGTEPRMHPMLPFAPSLRTMEDSLHLRERLLGSPRIAVIGSGILGSEIASAARKNDVDVLLVGRSGTLGFGGVGALLTEELSGLHEQHGVELALRSEITAATQTASGAELVFDDGTVRRFDLVVAMIGGTPRTQWLASSGLDIADGIACDSTGAAAPGVSAVGDVAAWADPITGRPVRVEHQTNAIEQAITVATRLAHGGESPQPVPFFWSEIHGTRINAYGWFDPQHPLVTLSADAESERLVLGSRDADDGLRGVVGWNASPREFRTARAAVATSSRPLITQP